MNITHSNWAIGMIREVLRLVHQTILVLVQSNLQNKGGMLRKINILFALIMCTSIVILAIEEQETATTTERVRCIFLRRTCKSAAGEKTILKAVDICREKR